MEKKNYTLYHKLYQNYNFLAIRTTDMPNFYNIDCIKVGAESFMSYLYFCTISGVYFAKVLVTTKKSSKKNYSRVTLPSQLCLFA